MKTIALLLLSSTFLIGCYYDKADIINPNAAYVSCDTSSVGYAQIVAPIVEKNCNSCHGQAVYASNGGNVPLYSLTVIKDYVNSNGSKLLNSINWVGGHNMPKSADKLSDCDINKITAWINKGFPQ